MNNYNIKNKITAVILPLLAACILCACSGSTTMLSVMYPYMNCTDHVSAVKEQDGSFSEPPAEGFPFPALLCHVPQESSQVMLVVTGKEGSNYWLLQLDKERWSILAGPRFCVVSMGAGEALYVDALHVKEKTSSGILMPQKIHGKKEGFFKGDGTDPAALSLVNKKGSQTGYLFGSLERTAEIGIWTDEANLWHLALQLDPACNPALMFATAAELGCTVEPGIPERFVFLAEATTGIREESRYAGSDNFTGAPIDGYYGSGVIVTHEMAAALQKAQNRLEKMGIGLLVYDGYRPHRAVEAIVAWSKNNDTRMKERYYPNLTKKEIMRYGFLACPSPHSSASSVDLTLVDLKSGQPLDMGGHFDLFDFMSVYNSPQITKEQFLARKLLRDTMLAAGFTALDLEWWHFDFKRSEQKEIYDFIIPY